jgi:hypothetical protein
VVLLRQCDEGANNGPGFRLSNHNVQTHRQPERARSQYTPTDQTRPESHSSYSVRMYPNRTTQTTGEHESSPPTRHSRESGNPPRRFPFPNRNFEYYRLLLRRAQRRECEKAQGTILPNRTTKTSQPGNPENLLAELLTGSAGLARFLWANPAPPYGQTAALRDSLNVPVLQAKLDGAGTSGIIVGGCTVTQVRR